MTVSGRKTSVFGACAIWLFLSHLPAAAATLNVPGDIPTIQQALDAAGEGDVVLVAPGTYRVTLGFKGGRKRVVLASWFFSTGEEKYIGQTVLQAGWKRSSWLGFRKAYVIAVPHDSHPASEIIGFTMKGGNDGISCRGKVVIRNNIFYGCRDGIDYEDGGGGICISNLIRANKDDGIDLDDAVDVVVENNMIRDNGDDGIEVRLNPYQAASKPFLRIAIRGNTLSGNGEDGIQLISYGVHSRRTLSIERNLFHRNAMAALACMGNAETVENYEAYALPERVDVINNTFADNTWGLLGGSNMAVLNNIFVGTRNAAVKNVGGNSVLSHNLFWSNGSDFEGSHVDTASTLRQDPLLSTDFRLKVGSPCADAGTALFRFMGELIKVAPGSYLGPKPDLGAFESN